MPPAGVAPLAWGCPPGSPLFVKSGAKTLDKGASGKA